MFTAKAPSFLPIAYAYGLDDLLLNNKVSSLDAVAYTDVDCSIPVSSIPVRKILTHSNEFSNASAAFLTEGDFFSTDSLMVTAVKIPKKGKVGYTVEFLDATKPALFIYSDNNGIIILSEE